MQLSYGRCGENFHRLCSTLFQKWGGGISQEVTAAIDVKPTLYTSAPPTIRPEYSLRTESTVTSHMQLYSINSAAQVCPHGFFSLTLGIRHQPKQIHPYQHSCFTSWTDNAVQEKSRVASQVHSSTTADHSQSGIVQHCVQLLH